MILTFAFKTELEVIEEFDEIEDRIIMSANELFNENDMIDVDIIEQSIEYIDVQFRDGSICLGIPKACFNERNFSEE